MRNEFTAVVERDRHWYIAYGPEIPGANGQGRTKAAALKSLSDTIALILEDRRKDGLRGIPAAATREKVVDGSCQDRAQARRDLGFPGPEDLPGPFGTGDWPVSPANDLVLLKAAS